MKAHLIETHLLDPRSRSSAKIRVTYQGHISPKMAVLGALVFYKNIFFLQNLYEIATFRCLLWTSKFHATRYHTILFFLNPLWERLENIVGKGKRNKDGN